MIHMSPFQSWSTMLLLAALAAALVWLIHVLSQARAEHNRLVASAADASTEGEPLASVTELRPSNARQLTLVPDLPRAPASLEVYDWAISGL